MNRRNKLYIALEFFFFWISEYSLEAEKKRWPAAMKFHKGYEGWSKKNNAEQSNYSLDTRKQRTYFQHPFILLFFLLAFQITGFLYCWYYPLPLFPFTDFPFSVFPFMFYQLYWLTLISFYHSYELRDVERGNIVFLEIYFLNSSFLSEKGRLIFIIK